jgi:hypothetical protein
MASVSVFVDDAVLGRLPNVCAKTGTPADGRQRIDQAHGGLGAAWLLLLLGPIGWVVFLVVALTSRPEVLTVRVPMSTAAVEHERRLSRARWAVAAGALLILGAGLLELEPLPAKTWLGFALVAGIAALALQLVLAFDRVGVRLDASHRWVTLSGVDPRFVSEVRAQQDAATGQPSFT